MFIFLIVFRVCVFSEHLPWSGVGKQISKLIELYGGMHMYVHTGKVYEVIEGR